MMVKKMNADNGDGKVAVSVIFLCFLKSLNVKPHILNVKFEEDCFMKLKGLKGLIKPVFGSKFEENLYSLFKRGPILTGIPNFVNMSSGSSVSLNMFMTVRVDC